jgi:hypothetical protein
MCFHKYGKWHVIEEGEMRNNMNKVKGQYFIQEKICEKCNKIKRFTTINRD